MRISEFHQFFLEQLKEAYWSEQLLVESLPKLQKASYTADLGNVLSEDLKATEQQLIRLEAAFDVIGLKPETSECLGMKGILAECDKIIADTPYDTMVRDAALIIVAQKIKHYEISAYGSLISLAQTMEMTEAAAFLSKTPAEEKRSDQALTQLAEVRINKEAARLQ